MLRIDWSYEAGRVRGDLSTHNAERKLEFDPPLVRVARSVWRGDGREGKRCLEKGMYFSQYKEVVWDIRFDWSGEDLRAEL